MANVREHYNAAVLTACKYLTPVLILITLAGQISAQTADLRSAGLNGAGFEERVNDYVRQREAVENALPKLSKQATAEEISVHKTALLKGVLAKRKGAKRGSVFTPEAEQRIRSVIAAQYKGRDRLELRKELAEAENASVPVRVNAVYPEASELLEMPATLLLALPELPQQVRYRFVGERLLLVDRENHLIIDYMPKVLP